MRRIPRKEEALSQQKREVRQGRENLDENNLQQQSENFKMCLGGERFVVRTLRSTCQIRLFMLSSQGKGGRCVYIEKLVFWQPCIHAKVASVLTHSVNTVVVTTGLLLSRTRRLPCVLLNNHFVS